MIGNVSSKVLNAKSIFNQRYQIILPGGVHAKEAKPRLNGCLESTKRFVSRELDISEQAWRTLISHHFSDTNPNANGAQETIAELIWRGRIAVYELPSLVDQRLMIPLDQTKGLRIINGTDANLYENEDFLKFNNPSDMAELISRAQSNPEGLEQALKNASPGESLNFSNKPASRILEEKLRSGELKIIEVKRQVPRTRSKDVETEDLPAEVLKHTSIPLAPESPKFSHIEFQLLYDNDGEPLADAAYKIIDSKGNEYSGKTDDKGMVRLDNIPVGDCEIRFPEIAGWSE